ncbi:Rv0340 family IniB-related protein [Mycobacterium sp. PSTR-4-N]|uniref:Rv0340 family IniB-related protein n=1 Tax=Mycobacterium sp. PSTR-4-N TaxID=2917745 RepID=UPI001F15466F|nr:Rv0340 family IniB-related protein [Mycobacterium sp. PSTR-4-N]MCG7595527.1 Rv0340 family protein [Mycobacterium sp. PSTR-4-N]
MANSLVDFVVSLVRDPAAAAAYAADPAQALADAHLTDVTSADVQNLLPVVAESLSTAVPAHSFDAFADPGLDAVPNVWSSGAASAAFDAFDDHVPSARVIDTEHSVPAIVDHLDDTWDVAPAVPTPDAVPSVQLDDPAVEHAGLAEPAGAEQWVHDISGDMNDVHDVHPVDHLPDVDLFH